MTTLSATNQHRLDLGATRLLTQQEPGYSEHLDTLGPVPYRPDLIQEVERSGLTGRGGAGFPAGRKLAAMAPRGVVIGNGSEGEPLSAKDELLLRRRPHLVIDGLLATSHAVRAKNQHLVVTTKTEEAVRRAIAERDDADRIEVVVTEDRFISGEASAVVNLLATGEAIPVDHPYRLTTRGRRRRSTLVQNVETLAHIALVARFGSARFRSVGDPRDPGTRLFSLSGDVAQPGITEAPGGASLRSVLTLASPRRVSAVLVGGYHGTWVGPDALDRPLAVPAVPRAVPVGAGIIVALGEGSCGLRTTSEIASYLAAQTAGQCGPCVNGLPALADLVARVAQGDRDPRLPAEIGRMITLVDGRGACHHPDGTARMVRSALHTFADDIHAHQHGHCEAAR